MHACRIHGRRAPHFAPKKAGTTRKQLQEAVGSHIRGLQAGGSNKGQSKGVCSSPPSDDNRNLSPVHKSMRPDIHASEPRLHGTYTLPELCQHGLQERRSYAAGGSQCPSPPQLHVARPRCASSIVFKSLIRCTCARRPAMPNSRGIRHCGRMNSLHLFPAPSMAHMTCTTSNAQTKAQPKTDTTSNACVFACCVR
jgi:hypothetical protein